MSIHFRHDKQPLSGQQFTPDHCHPTGKIRCSAHHHYEQGLDLVDLRLTWREMEKLIFGGFLMIFGDILEDSWRFFEELWRNWFIVRKLRTSIIRRPIKIYVY